MHGNSKLNFRVKCAISPRHSRESGNLFGAINFGISAHFFCKKRDEGGNLSVKMDSRFRGNDSVFSRKIPGNYKLNFRVKCAVPPRHSRERGNLFGAINFGIPAHFFCKKRDEGGNLSVKMDSRFRGNDGGFHEKCTEILNLIFA